MPDPLKPSTSLLMKLGSALVHAEEMIGPDGRVLDQESFKALANDAEVLEWRDAMDAMALLPVKR